MEVLNSCEVGNHLPGNAPEVLKLGQVPAVLVLLLGADVLVLVEYLEISLILHL